MIVDLFAGPGGWDLGARMLGLDPIGVESDRDACATRTIAGLQTVRGDVSAMLPEKYAPAEGLIASPPCTALSKAGKRQGVQYLGQLVEAIGASSWRALEAEHPLVWLALEVGRWTEHLDPEWVVLEQVPDAMPLWDAYVEWFTARGYSAWAGVLSAEQYGVPQTRRRAVLLASRAREVRQPPPTHQAYNPRLADGGRVGPLKPWVSMAEALGWQRPMQAGFPRADDLGTSEDGYRERDWRDGDEPAFALTEKARSWTLRANLLPNAAKRTIEATTVAGDSRLWPPGHKVNASDQMRLGTEEANERYGDRAGSEAIRLEIPDALTLQSFPPNYPVQGTRSSAFKQIGNAVPPLLAAPSLSVVTGREAPE